MLHPNAAILGMTIRPTFQEIHRRLLDVNVDLFKHMDLSAEPRPSTKIPHGLAVEDSVLEGIAFKVLMPERLRRALGTSLKNSPALLGSLRSAMREGRPVFREGNVHKDGHWAIDASMAVTTGIGFREITYLPALDLAGGRIAKDPSGGHAPSPNMQFSSFFGETRSRLDITSLHVAVWGNYCTVHIDHAGFTLSLGGLGGGDVIVSPDSLQHVWVELFQRDILGLPETFEWYMPNSRNDFSRTGIRLKAPVGRHATFSIEASYTLRGKRGAAGTVNFSGTFGE